MSDLHKKISKCMPDCMAPDGAPPCAGYTELLRLAEALEAENKLMKQKAATSFGFFWKGGWYSQDLRSDMEGEA